MKAIRRYIKLLKRVRTEVYIGLLIFLLLIIALITVISSPNVKLEKFRHYEKKLPYEAMPLCGTGSGKTYEDYRMITDETSDQYRLIQEKLKVDHKTGFLYDNDGFLAAALGYQFGPIGTRYYITLDTGTVLPLVKADEKAPKDASDGCQVDINGTVIEFVVDSDIALKYFGTITNGLVLDGNLNNSEYLQGEIVKIERVLEE